MPGEAGGKGSGRGSRDSLLNIAEAAEWLGVTPRLVRRLAQERRLPSGKVGRSVRFRRQDLEDHFDKHMRPVGRDRADRPQAGNNRRARTVQSPSSKSGGERVSGRKGQRSFGSVRHLPSGRWQARYQGRGGEPFSEVFDSKAAADAHLAEVQTDLARGTWRNPRDGRTLLRDYAERWLSSDLAKAPTTKARDAVVLRNHVLPALGALPLAEITPRDVQDVIQGMASKLSPKTGRTLQPKTVKTNAGVLQAVLSSAVREGFLGTSPYRSPRLPPLDQPERPRLTFTQQRALAAAMPEPYRIMVFLGGVLGLRFSEVVGLRVGDIDFLARPPLLRVDRPIVEVEGRTTVSRGKTPGSRATLTLPPFLVQLLAQHLAVLGRNHQEDLVVQAPLGGPVRAGNFRTRVWAPAVKAAGFPGLTFHGLRHSAAGVMRQAGASDQVVQHRMRHSHRASTTDIYSWTPDAMDAVAINALERLWSDGDGTDVAQDEGFQP